MKLPLPLAALSTLALTLAACGAKDKPAQDPSTSVTDAPVTAASTAAPAAPAPPAK